MLHFHQFGKRKETSTLSFAWTVVLRAWKNMKEYSFVTSIWCMVIWLFKWFIQWNIYAAVQVNNVTSTARPCKDAVLQVGEEHAAMARPSHTRTRCMQTLVPQNLWLAPLFCPFWDLLGASKAAHVLVPVLDPSSSRVCPLWFLPSEIRQSIWQQRSSLRIGSPKYPIGQESRDEASTDVLLVAGFFKWFGS